MSEVSQDCLVGAGEILCLVSEELCPVLDSDCIVGWRDFADADAGLGEASLAYGSALHGAEGVSLGCLVPGQRGWGGPAIPFFVFGVGLACGGLYPQDGRIRQGKAAQCG